MKMAIAKGGDSSEFFDTTRRFLNKPNAAAPERPEERPEERPRDTIQILRYTTADLPPEKRYGDWRARTWPRVDAVYRTDPIEPFNTRFESADLGEIIFVYTEITSMRWERRLQDIRSSDFDPIIVNMMVDGSAHGDFDGRQFREESGAFHFHDLGKPSIHVSTASRSYSVVIPRGIASNLFGTLADLHGLVVGGECAALLLGHAQQVWRALPDLDRSAAQALGRSLLDLLLVTLAQVRSSATPCARGTHTKLRRRAQEAIEKQLNKPLTISELCSTLKVSRKQIFAAFREDGGVHKYILTQRLECAKVAVADLERREPIGAIAVRLGFCDASHLTRLFRSRYGMAPREYRRLVTMDRSVRTEPTRMPAHQH